MPKTNYFTKQKTQKETTAQRSLANGHGNLFTFRKAKWPDPIDADHDTRVKVKFGKDKGATNGLEHCHKFHAIDGQEQPELFLQWLLTYKRKALTPTANLNDRAQLELLGLIAKGEMKTKITRSLEATDLRLWLGAISPKADPAAAEQQHADAAVRRTPMPPRFVDLWNPMGRRSSPPGELADRPYHDGH